MHIKSPVTLRARFLASHLRITYGLCDDDHCFVKFSDTAYFKPHSISGCSSPRKYVPFMIECGED